MLHKDSPCAPCVVISLDFELRWGMHDKLGINVDAYRANLEVARTVVVPALLDLFLSRNIRATWAMVGAIGCSDWSEYFSRAPKPPNYANKRFAISPKYADMDPEGILHFAPCLMTDIYATNGQDLGSHTFSHIFMKEPGVCEADAVADAQAVRKLMQEKLGHTPISLVFPRNQDTFVSSLCQHGIQIWRGNERPWYYQANNEKTNTMLPRCLRLIDAVNPLANRAYPLSANMTRAGQFVRFSLPDLAWKLHFARIVRNLTTMEPGSIFHMWWHPHNLGEDVQARMSRAAQLVDLIGELSARGRLVSKNMADIVQ